MRLFWRLSLVSLLGCIVTANSNIRGEEKLSFNRDIRPILSEYCFACHGFDAKKRQADLRLDVGESAYAERDGHAAVKPNDLAGSSLWERVTTTDPEAIMPPPHTKKQLTAEQKDLLRRWIEQGAAYQLHWAFEKPIATEAPAVKLEAWAKTPIDRFILARLESLGLQPQQEADKLTLIRRVSFTLTGLPPTIAEVEQYVNDPSPTAYEAMVERYFLSPRYGEEMARHWLDVARYADTHGLHLDNEREMWAYRDWVVKSFNDKMPFDQFTTYQLAGDLLPNPTLDQLVATGFNRCNVTTSEGGAIESEFLYRYAVDRASTTAETWLGLTGGCAVCHDHKFDPLSMKDFYSLYAFFYSAADPAMDGNTNTTPPFERMISTRTQNRLNALRQAENTQREKLEQWLNSWSYQDPADSADPNQRVAISEYWLDDQFPEHSAASCNSRNASLWAIRPEIQPVAGTRALKQIFADNYEDRFDSPLRQMIVPESGKLTVSVYVDEHEPSESLLLELSTSRGPRTLVWGNDSRYGGANGTDRIRVGDIPPGGNWFTHEVAFEKWGLQPGDSVQQVKFAQFGGVAYWDNLKVEGQIQPATDLQSSFKAWWKERTGIDTRGIPGDLAATLKGGPAKEPAPAAELVDRLKKFYLLHVARPIDAEQKKLALAWQDAQVARVTLEQSLPGSFIFKDLAQPRQAFVMMRGQYDKPGDAVKPQFPQFLTSTSTPSSDRTLNRLDLAQWLLTADNPLTARVTVNRFWQQVFGTGIVKTSFDFGSQGEPPTHPELLDWLSVWYRENGWNTKELIKLMVMSSAFRQRSDATPELLRLDPANRLYARGPRFRLDAEQVRDNALFVSGLIDFTMGGRGVNSYQPPNIWEPVGYSDSNTRFYLQDHGPSLYRRSIYAFLKRTAPPPFMSNFDAPNREQFCTVRERSNTPLQALQLMNDTQHFEAARALGERMIIEGGDSLEQRIDYGFRLTLSRPPKQEELDVVRSALDQFLQRFQNDRQRAEEVIRVGESLPKSQAPVAEVAAYTLVGNLLLNLDETVNRN